MIMQKYNKNVSHIKKKSSLCILDSSSLSDMSCASMSSQSIDYLFIFLVVSFTEQTFLILMNSGIAILFFFSMGCAFCK